MKFSRGETEPIMTSLTSCCLWTLFFPEREWQNQFFRILSDNNQILDRGAANRLNAKNKIVYFKKLFEQWLRWFLPMCVWPRPGYENETCEWPHRFFHLSFCRAMFTKSYKSCRILQTPIGDVPNESDLVPPDTIKRWGLCEKKKWWIPYSKLNSVLHHKS